MSNTDKKAGPTNSVQSSKDCNENMDEPLKSVFSTVRIIKVGTGTTAKKQETRQLWYIEQQGPCEYNVRKINSQFVPMGEETTIDREELLSTYTPEVEIHNSQVAPAIIALSKTINRGDKHRADGKLLSAEMEYSNALDVDETNVRATFGLGLIYLERKDDEKSQMVFEELVGMKAAFSSKHKHLFNEFGISLRKNEQYESAIQYYRRAAELTTNDENLFYNLARVLYEKGDWEQCMNFIAQSLRLAPQHEHALALCNHISQLAGDDAKREKLGKPPVSEQVVEQAQELIGDWKPSSRRDSKDNSPSKGTKKELDFTGF